nr:MAG TPA: baseplate protein [Bacteriophage sp.]DAH22232.1 MAG TPA: baseplate protein [Caudoviricetes sp.]
MDKTFDEAIAGIRTAERGVEVREDIAQGMEYVKQCAEEVTGQQQAALQAAQTATGAARTATEKAAAAAESESVAQTAAANAEQSAQSASADAKSAGVSAASAKAEADRAAAIVSTDKTLNVEGAPADAKAVGDALKGVISADAVKTLIADTLAKDHAKIKFWVSEDPTSPAALFGGSWEEIASERVLMGASRTHAAGTTVEAGLPNIKFSFTAATIGSGKAGTDYLTTGYKSSDFNLDASKSNAIYGRSNTVQPAAYFVHIWRRVA